MFFLAIGLGWIAWFQFFIFSGLLLHNFPEYAVKERKARRRKGDGGWKKRNGLEKYEKSENKNES